MTRKKTADTGPQLYIVGERYKWITYVEEGQEEDPIQCEVKIRKNLSNGELEELTFAEGATEEEMREALAPFVIDWNMGYRTPSGEAVKADPPAIAGGKQFGLYLPDRITVAIFRDLKFRSTGLVAPKSSRPQPSGVDTSDGSPSDSTEA